jgi:hypothetical protein
MAAVVIFRPLVAGFRFPNIPSAVSNFAQTAVADERRLRS